MNKFRNAEIKAFEFKDLQSDHVVSHDDFKAFIFQEIDGVSINRENVSDEKIRLERSFEEKSSFKIDSRVRDLRGLSGQEKADFESRVQEEVNKRLKLSQKDAYEAGFKQGLSEGKAEAYSEHQAQLTERVEEFSEIVKVVNSQSEVILEKNRHDIYSFVKRFTKWIVLKEINDKEYLEKLFEKLILELNARKNLIIKVGRANFEQMPDVISVVESRLGQLSNVRVEIVPEINYPGIILETENGLIDGSLEGIFDNIDKIFEQVVKHE